MGGDALICSCGFDICPSVSLSLVFFFLLYSFINFFSFSLFYYFLFLTTPLSCCSRPQSPEIIKRIKKTSPTGHIF